MFETVLALIYVGLLVFLFGWLLLDFTVALIIRVLAIKHEKFRKLLAEQRKHEMELRVQYLDFKHDIKLLKHIHQEKMAQIMQEKIEETKNDENAKLIF